jgi:hypothetical protein
VEFILLGTLALVAVIGLLWLFITSNPKALANVLRYIGAAVLFGFAIFLFLNERIGGAVFLATMAWGLFTGGRVWPGGWPRYNFPGQRSKPGGGQSTRVATDWIELDLDHDTGAMSGRVLKGAHAGVALSTLSKTELLELYREAAADEETVRLLEAYFDRTFGADWRNGAQQEHPRSRSSAMSRAEALKVLGLVEGASEREIRAAHKKLMMQNHPDRGGSDYLASKINEAKDVLLGG